jgi:hypothetical protein
MNEDQTPVQTQPVGQPKEAEPAGQNLKPVDHGFVEPTHQIPSVEGELKEFVSPVSTPVHGLQDVGATEQPHVRLVTGDKVVVTPPPGINAEDLDNLVKLPGDDPKRGQAVVLKRQLEIAA